MEPDEDICRCLPVSDGTNNHNEILTNHLFTKVFDFLFDGQSNKKFIISCGIKEKNCVYFVFSSSSDDSPADSSEPSDSRI